MKIAKFEQSGFILEASNGYRIGWDIGTRTPIDKLDEVPAVDAFLVSHIHGDHFSVEHINKLNPKKLYINQQCKDAGGSEIVAETMVIKAGDEFDLENIHIKTFEVDHGPNVEQPEDNMGFLIELEGQKVYFAGDMFNPSGISVEDLDVNIALIPVGTHYTFGPSEAYEFAKTFKKIGKIVPIHYSPNNHIYSETRDEFSRLASKDFEIDLTNLP